MTNAALTDDEKSLAQFIKKDKLKVTEIAKRFGCSRTIIYRRLDKLKAL